MAPKGVKKAQSLSQRPSKATSSAQSLVQAQSGTALADLASSIANEEASAAQSADILAEVAAIEPKMAVPAIEALIAGCESQDEKTITRSGEALLLITQGAPAKVAKHLNDIVTCFQRDEQSTQQALFPTLTALCSASITYQKKLDKHFQNIFRQANEANLLQWAMTILPVLKGEPHANLREIVTDRLNEIPGEQALQTAKALGITLRYPRPI